MARFSSTGQLIWVKQLGGAGDLDSGGLGVDPQSGDIVLAGSFDGALDFDGVTYPYIGVDANDNDAFVAKLDGSGEPQWLKLFAADDDQQAGALVVATDGSIYVGGSRIGAIDVGQGPSGAGYGGWLAHLDPAGNILQGRTWDDLYVVEELALDQAGDLLCIASYSDSGSFEGYPLTAFGDIDVLAAKFPPALGSPVWVTAGGSSGKDSIVSLGVDPWGNVVIDLDYENDFAFAGKTATWTGGVDLVTMKLAP